MRQESITRIITSILLVCLVAGVSALPDPKDASNSIAVGQPYVHKQYYNVMVMPGVNQSDVAKALYYLPNYYGFTFVPPNSSQVRFDTGVPTPWIENTIVVSPDTRANRSDYIGLRGAGNRVGVIQYRMSNSELASPYTMAVLIGHELGHEYERNNVKFSKDQAFQVWKIKNNGDAMLFLHYILSRVI